MSKSLEVLQALSDAFGVCGFEDEVRDVVRTMIEPHVDEMRVDTLGNLIATRKGSGADLPTLMIDAHLDEIGFMVQYIEDNGFIRFCAIGGWDARIIPSHAITIVTDDGRRVKGVVGTTPPHVLPPADREKGHRMEDLFLDIGATSAAEAAAMGVRVGLPAVIAYPFEQYTEQFVTGKGFDDRGGCAVLVRTLQELAGQELDVNLAAVFSVSEEVGLVGATTATYQVQPDIALVLEGTICVDTPGTPPARQPTRSGKGPAITVADGGQIVRARMVRALTSIGDRNGIPWQYKLPPFGGTNGRAVQLSRDGVLAGCVSLPVRYIHSPHSMLRLDDFEHTVQLVTAFAREA
ncbi:MAG: peptidase M42, partial [Chloroflexi bacterium]